MISLSLWVSYEDAPLGEEPPRAGNGVGAMGAVGDAGPGACATAAIIDDLMKPVVLVPADFPREDLFDVLNTLAVSE